MASRKNLKNYNLNIDYDIDLLFDNEEEKEKILHLTEFEREQIINEKIQKYEEKRERELLLNENKFDNAKDAIQDIKNKRNATNKNNKKLVKNNYIKKEDNLNDSYESGEISAVLSDDSKKDEDFFISPRKKNKKLVIKHNEYNNKDKNIFSDNEETYSQNNNKAIDEFTDSIIDVSDNELLESNFELNIAELEKIRISREDFERYYDHKLFDKAVLNCPVKLNVGGSNSKSNNDRYMIATIKEVLDLPDEPYKVVGNNKQFTKHFIAKHAEEEKKFNFAFVSNACFDQFEFDKWLSRNKKANIKVYTKEDIKMHQLNLSQMKNYIYSQEEIIQKVNTIRFNKIKNRDSSLNITQELDNLNEKYEACKMKIIDLEDDINRLQSNTNNDNTIIKDIKEQIAFKNKEINTYKIQIQEIDSYLKILKEMQLNRLNLNKSISKNEIAFKINQRNLANQKKIDIEKRTLKIIKDKDNIENSNIGNPYKRRECNPITLFSNNNDNKDTNNNSTLNNTINNIVMTKVQEDLHSGTPKDLYDNKKKEIELRREIYKNFDKKCKDISIDELIEKLDKANNNLMVSKKGYFGILDNAKINIYDYIKLDNERLMKKYNIIDIKDIGL